jgi:hypothetical protein
MALVLDDTRTTLWDQVQYAGDPRDFAWVLPVHGTVVVGIGSDLFMSSLDAVTAPVIHRPVPNCPASGGGGGSSAGGCDGSSGGGGALEFGTSGGGFDLDAGYADDSGVTVTSRSTVGPYEVVQVHGTDEGSIVGWLRKNSYTIPTDIEPMLSQYVTEGFDFVAVRLRPAVGVQAMTPIRVTFPGRLTALPLRMVAAGVGTSVGIELFVVGDGRWRPANFPSFEIQPDVLTWDFQAQRSDYTTLRKQLGDDFLGRAFAIESSIVVSSYDVPSGDVDAGLDDAGFDVSSFDAPHEVEGDALDGGADVDPDAAADIAPDGDAGVDAFVDAEPDTAPDTAPDSVVDTGPKYDAGAVPGVGPATSDRDIVFGAHTTRRVTRLRADLPAKYLDVDLHLEADTDQSLHDVDMYVSKSVNDATVCPPAPQTSPQSNGGLGCLCVTGAVPASDPRRTLGVLAALLVLGVRVVRRRR